MILAFAVSLFINNATSYLAGVWMALLGFHLYSARKQFDISPLGWLMAIWALFLFVHTVFIQPTFPIFMTMVSETVYVRTLAFHVLFTFAALSIIPLYYFTIGNLKFHLWGCGAVLSALASYICYLWLTDAENIYRASTFFHDGTQWIKQIGPENRFTGISGPLIDRNNTALLMNVGLIAAVGAAIYPLACVFALALFATGSKAGLLSAAVCLSILIFVRHPKLRLPIGLTTLCAVPGIFYYGYESFITRLPIWEGTLKIIQGNSLKGTGLATFAAEYEKVRTEHHTGGVYAHNDLLQFASEMGIIAPVIFGAILLYIAFRTTKENIVSACVILAITLQAMVEFQFYVPPAAVLAAIAFKHWRNNEKRTYPH